MANKDPAFLFYSADFLVGVEFMEWEDIGKYIVLICTQHQHGHLSLAQIERKVGKPSKDLLSKFIQDDEGNYYNERIEKEINKRKAHAQKQRENVMKRWEKEKNKLGEAQEKEYDGNTMVLPRNEIGITTVIPLRNENENKNINEDINENKDKYRIEGKGGKGRFVPPTVDEVRAYCHDRQNGIDPEAFIDFYESKGWMVGKNKMKDWKATVRNWERRNKNNGRSNSSEGCAPKPSNVSEEFLQSLSRFHVDNMRPEDFESD